MNTIRWNVAVSADTDQSLRMFLASQGGGRKGDRVALHRRSGTGTHPGAER